MKAVISDLSPNDLLPKQSGWLHHDVAVGLLRSRPMLRHVGSLDLILGAR
jgi:hypothetical protein